MADQGSSTDLLKAERARVQQKTFTNWFNSHVKKHDVVNSGGHELVADLLTDLHDGVLLHALLECLSKKSLKKLGAARMRLQMVNNLNTSLEFCQQEKIRLVNVGAGDILDSNATIILGLIWTLICHYSISSGTGGGGSAKQQLVSWMGEQAADSGITSFDGNRWADGIFLSTLVKSFNDALLPPLAQIAQEAQGVALKRALQVADDALGIDQLLDAEDFALADEQAVMAYVSQFLEIEKEAVIAPPPVPDNSDELERLRQEVARLQAEEEARAKKLSDAEAQIRDLGEEADMLRESEESADAALRAEREKTAGLQSELDALRSEGAAGDEALRKQLAEAQQNAKDASEEADMLRESEEAADSALRQAKEELAKSQADLDALRKAAEKAQADLLQADQSKGAQADALAKAREAAAALRAQTAQMSGLMGAIADHAEGVRDRVSSALAPKISDDGASESLEIIGQSVNADTDPLLIFPQALSKVQMEGMKAAQKGQEDAARAAVLAATARQMLQSGSDNVDKPRAQAVLKQLSNDFALAVGAESDLLRRVEESPCTPAQFADAFAAALARLALIPSADNDEALLPGDWELDDMEDDDLGKSGKEQPKRLRTVRVVLRADEGKSIEQLLDVAASTQGGEFGACSVTHPMKGNSQKEGPVRRLGSPDDRTAIFEYDSSLPPSVHDTQSVLVLTPLQTGESFGVECTVSGVVDGDGDQVVPVSKSERLRFDGSSDASGVEDGADGSGEDAVSSRSFVAGSALRARDGRWAWLPLSSMRMSAPAPAGSALDDKLAKEVAAPHLASAALYRAGSIAGEMESELKDVQRELRSLLASADKAKADLEQGAKREQELNGSIDELNRELEKLKGELQEAETARDLGAGQAADELSRLRQELAKATSDLEASKQAQEAQAQELTQTSADLEKSSAHAKELEGHCDECRRELEEMTRKEKDCGEAKKTLQDEIDRLKAELEALTKQLSEKDLGAGEAADELSRLRKELATATSDLEASKQAQEAQAQELTQTSADLEKSSAHAKELEGHCDECRRELEEMTRKEKDCGEAKKTLQDEIDRLKAELEALISQLDAKDSSSGEALTSLREALAAAQAETAAANAAKESEVAAADDAAKQADSAKEKALADLAALRAALDAKEGDAATEASLLRKELDALNQENDELRASAETDQAALKDAEKALAQFRKHVGDWLSSTKCTHASVDDPATLANTTMVCSKCEPKVPPSPSRIPKPSSPKPKALGPRIRARKQPPDDVDKLVQELAAGFDLPHPLERLKEGQYQYGNVKINMKILSGHLVVRVGGGFLKFAEWADRMVAKGHAVDRSSPKKGVGASVLSQGGNFKSFASPKR